MPCLTPVCGHGPCAQDQGLLAVAEAHCLRALEYGAGAAAPAKDKAQALLREIRRARFGFTTVCARKLHPILLLFHSLLLTALLFVPEPSPHPMP
jgi:hypothetical protein